MTNKLDLIGYASGIAGANVHAGEGPLVVRDSHFLQAFLHPTPRFEWQATIAPPALYANNNLVKDIASMCTELAELTKARIERKQRFTVIGGDHTSAIGTFSGVAHALRSQGDLGLIWIDAHMDSHTPQTSESGHIHGMPVAALLGHGFKELTDILDTHPKIKPQHLSLIGVRSFEHGEANFLRDLNVRIYYMEEVQERGLMTVIKEAQARAKQGTAGYGVTLDLDALDPADAPGVDVPEPNGLRGEDVIDAMSYLSQDFSLLATEIVEFDPKNDIDQRSEKLIAQLLGCLMPQAVTVQGVTHA